MIRRTGLARHPETFNSILELLRHPEKYEENVFNTEIFNLIGEWYKQDNNKETKPNLVVTGLGSIGAASLIKYETVDEKIEILEKLDDEVPRMPVIQDIIKTRWDTESGIIINTEGEYSDSVNVGVWIPEQFVDVLNLQVHVIRVTDTEN
jgi:hypothetical protein